MSIQFRSLAKWTALAVAGVLVALALLLAFLDLNDLREPIAKHLSVRLDRAVRIEGDLSGWLLSRRPRVRVKGLELGNPLWAGRGDMARVEDARVELKLWPLLRGDLELTRLEVRGAKLHLVRDPDGRVNWAMAWSGARKPPQREAGEIPVIHHLIIENAQVTMADQQRKLKFTGMLAASEKNGDNGSRPFQIRLVGDLNGEPFHGVVRGGSLAKVRRDAAYPFDMNVIATNTRLVARGTIERPFKLDTARAQFTLSGYDMSNLYFLTGLVTPSTPPYRVTSQYSRDGAQVHLKNFAGRVGDSDLRGDITIDVSGARPRLMAALESKSLDLDDLGVLLGAPPTIKQGETASPEQVKLGREMAAKRRVFPDRPLEFERMRHMDAAVTLTAGTITARKIPLKRFSMTLQLNRGQLVLDPINFEFPQGRLAGYAWVDSSQEIPQTHLDVRLSGVQLGQFKPKTSRNPPLEGTLHGRASLVGFGDSLHDIVSSADGSVTLIVPQGEVREAFAELTGINVSRGLGLLLADDQEKTGVRCGVADFKVVNGEMQAQNLVFDTDDVLITGKGAIDLETERFDITVQGRPKKLRFFRVKAPIAVRGPLRRPDIGVDAGNVLGQGGIAAALAALTGPLAAVLAFVDPGLEKDANCSGLMAEAQKAGAVRSAATASARSR